jgi:hypothetical protein
MADNRRGGNTDPVHVAPTPEQARELARLEQAAAAAETEVQAAVGTLERLVAEWEQTLPKQASAPAEPWQPFEPLELRSAGGATFRRIEDGTWFVEGSLPPRDTYEFEAPLPAGRFGGLRLHVLPDTKLAGGGFGRADNGNIVVTAVEVALKPVGTGAPQPVDLVRAEADYEQRDWPAAAALGRMPGMGWAIDGHLPARRQPRRLDLFPATAVVVPEQTRLLVRIRQDAFDGHALGRFRLEFSEGLKGRVEVRMSHRGFHGGSTREGS